MQCKQGSRNRLGQYIGQRKNKSEISFYNLIKTSRKYKSLEYREKAVRSSSTVH